MGNHQFHRMIIVIILSQDNYPGRPGCQLRVASAHSHSSGSMASSQLGRVICHCPRCHPGKIVSLRTRQAHNRAHNSSQIRGDFSSTISKSSVGDDSYMDEEPFDDGSYMRIEQFDSFPDEEGMDGFTGFGLVMSRLNFR